MIHTIEISPETDLGELKKLFRKKLMTGGAVLRLREGLSEQEQFAVFEKFAPSAESDNLSSMVLVELAKQQEPAPRLLAQLKDCNLRNVNIALRGLS